MPANLGFYWKRSLTQGEMDSVPRLNSVLTLVLSVLWHLGLTASNCEYLELGGRKEGEVG